MKKLIFTLAAIFTVSTLAVSAIFAFDWPQNEILSDSFFSYFGQLRGGTIGTSLVFSESREVKAADDGRILAIISEHDEDELFESTLGNAAILAHKDSLITVYANLDAENLPSLFSMTEIKSGTSFGTTGTSSWQQGQGCLEFQVLGQRRICSGGMGSPRVEEGRRRSFRAVSRRFSSSCGKGLRPLGMGLFGGFLWFRATFREEAVVQFTPQLRNGQKRYFVPVLVGELLLDVLENAILQRLQSGVSGEAYIGISSEVHAAILGRGVEGHVQVYRLVLFGVHIGK